MRVRLVALFIFVCTLALGAPSTVSAVLLDSQTDDSAQATRPPVSYVSYGGPFVQVYDYHAVGYVPPVDLNLAGVRFRVNTSGGGDYLCPSGSIIQYYGTSTPATWNSGVSLGAIVLATTTPGLNGNCDYTTTDLFGQSSSIHLSSQKFYVFLMAVGGNLANWVSMSGKAYSSSTQQNFFGYRPDINNNYVWGTTGLEAVYFEMFDTAPSTSYASPVITLTGDAATTVEFGSIFTDPGATAQDAVDGDLTSAIQITGLVDTGVVGTTTLTYVVANSHGLSATTTRAVVVACTHDCYSNVLFLPGIEGSRLYEGQGTNCTRSADEKLWEPVEVTLGGIWNAVRGAGDDKVKNLFLDEAGASSCSTVYTKPGDIIDVAGGGNIYKSLIDEMNGMKLDSTIADWKPVAYDWRLSFDDLLSKGTERGGKIFYEEATSTPYIEQSLRALASRSKTRKVSIVAHSNGGLLAKALLNKLAGESTSLVDKVIMVGVPQSGAPEALGETLVGHNAGIYKFGYPIVSNAVARTLAENSPMAYHLLPSQNYFDSVMNDADHPVARFTGDAYPKEISTYGPVIGTLTELDDFLLARDDGREKPAASDVSSPNILNANLVTYANSTHSTLDYWVPPAGIEVSQIAGWGADTVAGIDFYTLPKMSGALTALGPVRAYKPILTEDGDGTVPVPSALLMSTSTENVRRYWLNLEKFNREQSMDRKHKDLFEIQSVKDFVKDTIKNSNSSLPAYISTTQPSPTIGNKKLTFFLHSPLTLELTDSSGNVTGVSGDGSMTQNIPDSSYGEFGEVKYITVPQGNTYQLSMHGQASGTFSLDMQESSGGVVTNSSTIANVPTTANTLASLTISDGIDTASLLTVDKNGDGKTFTISPKVGETVNYEEPRHARGKTTPIPIASSASEQGQTPVITLSIEPVIDQTPATSTEATTTPDTQPVMTTPEIVASVAIVHAEKKAYVPIAKPQKTEASPKEVNLNTSQTASVYDASQQPVLKKLGEAVYTGLYRLWTGLRSVFHLK